ncbi:hypothetical protein V6N13_123523 [Hibiscus sabdariffa]
MSRLQLHIVFCRSRMPASGGRISAFSAASHGLHFTCRLQLLHMSPAATAVQLHFHMVQSSAATAINLRNSCTTKHKICSSGAAGHEPYPCINLRNSCTAKHRICSPCAEGDMSAMNLGRLLQLPICYNYKWSPPAEDNFL